MPKAILELEMPGSCAECPCKGTDVWGMVRCRLIHMKSDKYSGMAEGYAYKRRDDCPLNPAENEQLQAQVARMREALRKAREAIKAAWSDGSANAAMDKAGEALAEIDKVIGGKEDAGKK